MAETKMTEQDFQQIEAFIKENFSQWIMEQEQKAAAAVSPFAGYALSERIVRVEEELKHQYEAIKDLQKSMDARFAEQQVQSDQRFAEMQSYLDRRFNDMQIQMDRRFGEVDKRFEQVDKRFEQMDKRFDESNRRFTIFSSILALLIAAVPVGLALAGL